jgi:hypothetical protein
VYDESQNENKDLFDRALELVDLREEQPIAEAAWAASLNLTAARNSHSGASRPEKYGKTGITGYGQKMVKSAATLIQKMPGKRTTFATVTMPSLAPQLRRELALAWPELLRQLIQWLSRRLKAQGLPALICSATEIQPGRLSEYREAYLHLHLVWPNHHVAFGHWAVDVFEMRTWISEFLQRRGIWEVDSWVNVNVQRVKKSAAGYLAKYMSKGVDEIEAFAADCGWDAVPSQWWNLSKPARDLVKKYTCEGLATGRLLRDVIDFALDNCEIDQFHVLKPAVLEWEGRPRIVGWFGAFKESSRKKLVSMIRGDNSGIIIT